MAKGRLGGALRDVQTLFGAGTAGGLTDGQLLEEFRDPGRRGAGARLRGPGRAARPGGPARLPLDPPRRARGGGRLPGGRSSSWRARPARCGCGTRWPPGCTRSPCRVARCARATAARRRRHERQGGRAGRSVGPRPGPRRPRPGHPRGDRPAAGAVPRPDRALLPGGPDAGAGGGQLRWPLGDVAEPAGAGARTAAPAADPPGRGALGGRCPRRCSGRRRRGRSCRPRWRTRRPGPGWHPRRGGRRSSARSRPRPRSPRRS